MVARAAVLDAIALAVLPAVEAETASVVTVELCAVKEAALVVADTVAAVKSCVVVAR